jgi:hypothetical protein
MPSCYERSSTFASLLIVRDGYCSIDVACAAADVQYRYRSVKTARSELIKKSIRQKTFDAVSVNLRSR